MTPPLTTEPGDWVITLTARNPDLDQPGGSTYQVLPEGIEEQDAITDLEGVAELLAWAGHVPDNGDNFRSLSPIDVGRRLGKRSYAVRLDGWERETENGYDNGHGYLRLEWRPR